MIGGVNQYYPTPPEAVLPLLGMNHSYRGVDSSAKPKATQPLPGLPSKRVPSFLVLMSGPLPISLLGRQTRSPPSFDSLTISKVTPLYLGALK